jgi:hypothetical protein
MGIKEKTNRKNCKNRKDKTRNIENIERRWIEKIASITRNRIVVTTIDVKITTSIVDTENAPMTKIAIT